MISGLPVPKKLLQAYGYSWNNCMKMKLSTECKKLLGDPNVHGTGLFDSVWLILQHTLEQLAYTKATCQ